MRFAIASILLVMTGCGSSGPDSSDATDGAGAAAAPGQSVLAPCSGGAPAEAEADTTLIAKEFQQSMHELIVCGGLQASLVSALLDALATLVQDPGADATPEAFTYVDGGLYHTAGQATTMDVELVLGEDFGFGKAGDVVVPNVFVMSTYLQGAKSKLNVAKQQLELTYAAPGPLVELLGFGPNPPNPLIVKLSDTSKLRKRLESLRVRALVKVDDKRPKSTVTYDVRFAAAPLLDALGATGSAIDVDAASAERPDLEQTLATTRWEMRYVGNLGILEGEVDFEVQGELFPFHGTLSWSGGGTEALDLRCP